MSKTENTGWAQLSPEKVRAIYGIEPPEHDPDFWDGIERAIDESTEARVEPPDRRPNVVGRAAALTVAAAALLIIAMITLRPREPSQEVDSISDPAQTDGRVVTPDDSRTDVLSIPDPGTDPEVPSTTERGSTSIPASTDVDAQPAPTVAPGNSSSSTDSAVSSSSTHPATNQNPVRLEAELMETRTNGDFEADGWSLWSAGHVEEQVNLPAEGTYRLTVRAEGRSKTTTKPEMTVRLDGVLVGATIVEVDDVRLYRFTVAADAGTHRIRVAFTNDPNTPDNDVDLIIDYVELALVR